MHSGDQHPEQHEEFSLLRQIGFARLPNHVGDAAHRLVNRQRPATHKFPSTEQRANRADGQPQIQQGVAAQTDARKRYFLQGRAG